MGVAQLHIRMPFPRRPALHPPPPPSPPPYASLQEDLERVRRAGNGRVDITVGSALNIFGGALPYADVVAWHKQQAAAAAAGGAAAPAAAAPPATPAAAATPAAEKPASGGGAAEVERRGNSESKLLGEPQDDGTILYRDIASMIEGEAQADGTSMFRF